MIFGKSGTGKTTLLKQLIEDEDLGLTPIVTCTTRPPRTGEVNEVDYYFISEEEFNELKETGELMEYSSYEVANGETWYYGSLFKDFIDNKDRIIVVNPDGIKSILDNCKRRSIPTSTFLISASDSKRTERLLKRGDDKNEITRRIKADNKDFADAKRYANHKIDTTRTSANQTYNKVKKIIERERK
jgi:guanylate kinase